MSDIGNRLGKALAGRYDIERELGHGGMATVHLARDVKHGRTVAIKVLRPDLAQAVGSERFLREINIAAQLQSPHILPLLESGEADGLLYYVMPFVEGDSLRARLVKQGTLPASEAMRLLRDIVDALAHAHRHNVVHRDIKPDNVMIADRHAVVMDFGVAKAMSDAKGTSGLTSIGISLGTPAYMAPEQAAADPFIDHRADIYSVGVVAYEMLAGAPPFIGTPQAVLSAQIAKAPAPLLQLKPDTPPAVAQIVMKCLEKDPANRYQTADDLLQAIESLVTPSGHSPPLAETRSTRTRRRVVQAAVLIAIVAVSALAMGRVRSDRWVHQTALPELRRLIDAAENDSAFALALRIEEIAPDDSTLGASWPRFTRRVVVRSNPEGATVYRASTADTSQWFLVGTTPTDSVRLPTGVSFYRFEKDGHRTAYSLFHSNTVLADIGYLPPMQVTLDSLNAPFPEMIWIPGGYTRAFLVGSDGATPLALRDYRIDRFEVSNSQYKAFVDAGGYTDRKFWEHEFVDENGRTISFEAAIAGFVDRTGRPGPATWEAGTFPAGQGDLPVGGVSWYEAAAFAKFAGKSLPTIYHWARAAAAWNSKYVVPFSNLEGNGPLPTGTTRGMSIGGVSDMAGNVREWCINDAGRNQRFILGGGWSDPKYAFVDAYAQPPMNRAAINGIRLAKYESGDTIIAQAARPIPRAFTDYSRERPVSDAVYASYRPYFDYDPIALDAKVEMRDSTAGDWIAEKVSFTAAYGGERMTAWLYIPRNAKPPYQTVVLFPGSGAIGAGPFNGVLPPVLNYVAPSGRIAVYPIYKSTHERSDSLRSDLADQSIFWRDHVVMWVKDYRRTLDYLSTRADVDTTKFAYFGFSWGGYMGGIIPAVEPRIKASMLYVAGLTMERGRPEVEPINHLPRVKSPVLMLNGKYDFFFPSETAQKPFFEFLGTPAPDKVWKLYEGGHDVPRTELIKESLAWLDKYLGPVKN
ncbi:MAG TPA: protein kinase [Gemmatimonadaceae bacterium]|nr:protein kinase [Gemmatimonadaceae bacterium]